MLRRQKIILAMLDNAGNPLHQTKFVKLAFLLSQETKVRDDATFEALSSLRPVFCWCRTPQSRRDTASSLRRSTDAVSSET